MSPADPITARQPVKALYVAASLIYCVFLRLPVLAIYFLRAPNRPDAEWTWKQSVGMSTVKFLFSLASRARFAREFPVDRSGKDPKKPLIPAATQDKLQGVLQDPVIKPTDLMGAWYPAELSRRDASKNDTKVILFMFGGAYVMGDTDPANYMTTLKQLCPALDARFLLVGYRLAGSAGGQPFPAQLQDLLSAYLYVLELGVAPKDIIIAGESAGGNAVLAFLRYIEGHARTAALPRPGAALLSSPWVDLTPDPALRAKDLRYKTDFAGVDLVIWGQQAFIPSNRTASDVYISPAIKPFKTETPVWMEAGTGEATFDAQQSFVDSMKAAGTDIVFFPVPNGTHAHMWAAGMVGFDATKSVRSFLEFMKERGV